MSSVLGFEQHLPQSACWTVLCQGAPPFNMTEAADHLTALATGTLPQHPPLPVGRTASVTVFWSLIWEEFDSHLCRMLPSPGPAVGPGQSVPRHRGQNLEPAAWHIQFKSLSSKNYLRSIVHVTYLVREPIIHTSRLQTVWTCTLSGWASAHWTHTKWNGKRCTFFVLLPVCGQQVSLLTGPLRLQLLPLMRQSKVDFGNPVQDIEVVFLHLPLAYHGL